VLIVRSWLLPGVVGVLMIAAGVCYLVNSLVFIDAPALVGELSLASWLAVKGVKVAAPEARWPRPLRRSRAGAIILPRRTCAPREGDHG
jgi:hypothetical protein